MSSETIRKKQADAETGWESVATMANKVDENEEEPKINERFLIDEDVDKQLESIIDFLKTLDGTDQIIENIENNISSGKYRDARIGMEDGKIKIGEDAEKERLSECYFADIPGENEKLNDKFDRLAEGVGEFLTQTKDMFRAATYGYGEDYLTGDVFADDDDVMGQLSGRIGRNVIKGVFDGAKIEYDGAFNPGTFWSEEACHVYQRRAKKSHLEAEKENPETVSKFNQEYAKLQKKNPEIFKALLDVSERLMVIAGNGPEAYTAIDILQNCVANGMYDDAYIDNQGWISKNNPEEILDNHADELTSTKEEIMEAYNKKTSELDSNEAKIIVLSPLAFKYFRKPGSNQKEVMNIVLKDKSFTVDNWETVKWMLGDDYKRIKAELGIE